MKTINKKKTAIAILFSLILALLIIPVSMDAAHKPVTLEEQNNIEEQEITVEPWMTSTKEFNLMISNLRLQKRASLQEEETEEPVAIEPWMFDMYQFNAIKFNKIEAYSSFNTNSVGLKRLSNILSE